MLRALDTDLEILGSIPVARLSGKRFRVRNQTVVKEVKKKENEINGERENKENTKRMIEKK